MKAAVKCSWFRNLRFSGVFLGSKSSLLRLRAYGLDCTLKVIPLTGFLNITPIYFVLDPCSFLGFLSRMPETLQTPNLSHSYLLNSKVRNIVGKVIFCRGQGHVWNLRALPAKSHRKSKEV